MKYFQEYESRRNLYKKVQPNTLWKSKNIRGITFLVKSIDLNKKTVSGLFCGRHTSGLEPIKWLIDNYELEC